MHPSPVKPSPRAAHPRLPALVGHLDLSAAALRGRPDAEVVAPFAKMLANAEYWLSFDLARFEPMLARCPSPLRELGVAVLLRYSEDVGGALSASDLAFAEEDLASDLPEDLKPGILAGLETLRRAVDVRDRRPDLEAAGYAETQREGGLAVHALRAMGSADIEIVGVSPRDKAPELPIGEPVALSATDERGRPLGPPEVESRLGASVLAKDDGPARSVVFLVPGEYKLRVPSKATGDRKVIAR